MAQLPSHTGDPAAGSAMLKLYKQHHCLAIYTLPTMVYFVPNGAHSFISYK